MLTPIAKSWPSEWCLEANSLAIQVHGGYGYTRDFPVEQYWRDNRLNMIHEGTHGIQALDLLGPQGGDGGRRGPAAARARASTRRSSARAQRAGARPSTRNALGAALQQVGAATQAAWATGDPDEALANAAPYLQAFGHMVLAWIWLDVALARVPRRGARDAGAARAARRAARYFFHYELPKIGAWLQRRRDARRHLPRHARGVRSEARSAGTRVEALIWVLIYGGLFVARARASRSRAAATVASAGASSVLGGVLASRPASCWSGVRSRMPERRPAPIHDHHSKELP